MGRTNFCRACLPVYSTRLLNLCKARTNHFIIVPHFQWAFTGVETMSTAFDFPIYFIFFPDFILKVSTF